MGIALKPGQRLVQVEDGTDFPLDGELEEQLNHGNDVGLAGQHSGSIPLTYDSQASLKEEPLIGYAVASDRTGAKTVILLCRYAVRYSLDLYSTGATYASYLSALGRIITRIPGETHAFAIKHRTGLMTDDHLYTLRV